MTNAKIHMRHTLAKNGKEEPDNEYTDTEDEGEDAVEPEAEEATVQETSEGGTAYE